MEIVLQHKEIPYNGARQKQKAARMGFQDGTRSNTEEQGGKDLGVVIQDTHTLSPECRISQLFESTYKVLTKIRMAFHYMDRNMMKKILPSMVCPRLEFAAMSPNMRKRYKKIRKDQKKNGTRTKRSNV